MMNEQDRARVGEAIQAAERGTSGEIVCVLARASSDYATMPLAWSMLSALAAPWLMLFLTRWTVERLLIVQLAIFAVALLILSVPAIRVLLTPRRVRRAHAHQAAAEQFLNRGLMRAKSRKGVMIFVSLSEHYVRVIADEGVAEKVSQSEWQAIVDLLVSHMREDRIAEGFLAAIAKCGDILARHLPAEPGKANELPDRLFII